MHVNLQNALAQLRDTFHVSDQMFFLTSTVEERPLENNKPKDVLHYDVGTNFNAGIFFS